MDTKKSLLVVVTGIVITALFVGAGFLFFLNKTPGQPETNNTLPTEIVTKDQTTPVTPVTPITPVTDPTVYFGKGSQDNYSLVNVQTGEIKNFIPKDYVLLSQFGYQMFPTFLILQKDDGLYSYSVENNIVNSVFGSFDDLKLKDNEEAIVYPSITEKNKFIIEINTLDLSQVSDFTGLSPILSTRSYSFDALTNKLAATVNGIFYNCAEYDSKNQRFFTWSCGEGVGSALPLLISDLEGNTKSQIITEKDFGLTDDDLIHVYFSNGLFLAIDNSNGIKVIVLDPALADPSKEIYTATTQANSQISDLYAYSMGIDKTTNTLIVGGNDYILLLRFDENKKITQSTYIPDKEIYTNFLFLNEGKLYYQAYGNIRVVDLNSWKIDKSIPSAGTRQEITLFAF